MDYLLEFGPWLWLVAAVLLVVLEIVIPGIHFLWFGVAATIVGVVALMTGMDWQWQVLLFGVLSAITAIGLYFFAKPQDTSTDRPGLNKRGSYYVGRIVVVADPIRNGRGRVRVGDTLWAAAGPDQPEGARVKVTRMDGTVLMVEAIEG